MHSYPSPGGCAKLIYTACECSHLPNRAHNNGATPDLIACPRTEAVLTHWRLFSSSQRRAVRTHGWTYLESPKWQPSAHPRFPQSFKLVVSAMVVSMHLSGLVARGTGELSVLLASAIDATHRSGVDMLGNNHGIVASIVATKGSEKSKKSKRTRSAYSYTISMSKA